MTEKALFLDRDGVINEELGYLHKAEQVRFMPGIFALCRRAKSLGYRLVVVTNQAGIGRGLYTLEQFETLTEWMHGEFAREGITLDAVLYSPYHPEEGIGEYKRDHPDRKPHPGMLLRAAAMFSLDLSQSLLVGDRCSDIAAANAAGLRQAFLIAGTEQETCPGDYLPVRSLAQVEDFICDLA